MTTRIYQFGCLACLFVTVVMAPLRAAESMVPEQISGVEILNAESLILLAQGAEQLAIIDARLHEDRSIGYIENSLNLPDVDTNCTTLNRVVSYRSQPVVVYSNDEQEGRSVRTLHEAINCGYPRLYWLRGGFKEWQNRDYPYLLD